MEGIGEGINGLQLLRGGMRRQLKKNELLREFFDLGAPVEETDERMNKANRVCLIVLLQYR